MADCQHGQASSGCAMCASDKVIAALREELEQARNTSAIWEGQARRIRTERDESRATIVRQREWIEATGHRPGCAALRCIEWHVEVGGLCGTYKENHEMHLWHEFQPGKCDCGWAEHTNNSRS